MRFVTAAVLCLLCYGCAAHRGHDAYDGVSDSFPGASETLAGDAADRLIMAFAPGRTVLSVNTDSKFGRDLESSLRRKGFAIAPHGLTVGYNTDLVRDETSPMCYVRLSLPNGNLSQLYTLHNGRAVAAGGVAKTGLPDFDPDFDLSAPVDVAEAPLFDPEDSSVSPSNSLFEIAPAPAQAVAPVSKVRSNKVRADAAAKDIARRNAVPVYLFCRWNNVEPDTLLTVGRDVYLKDPGFVHGNTLKPVAAPTATPLVASPKIAALPVVPAVASPPPSPAANIVAGALNEVKAIATEAAAVSTPAPVFSPAPASAPALPVWDIRPGMLRPQLETWTAQAGYQLIWKAAHDFEMQSRAMFQDDFLGAVKRLFAGLHQHGNPLRATIYQDNRVLEIVED